MYVKVCILVSLYILYTVLYVGITDRVVNQLLTLLDGVEATMSASGNRTSTLYSGYDSDKGNEGNDEGVRDGGADTETTTGDNKSQKVISKSANTTNTNHAKASNNDDADDDEDSSGGEVYILAATSRPDLSDLALLGPGRIDRHIYLSYPTPEDRYSILQTIYTNSIPTISTISNYNTTSDINTNIHNNNNTLDTTNNNNTANNTTNTINDILYKISYDKHSDYFSVSDLQSIFTIAHLTLIQRYMMQQEERESEERKGNNTTSINSNINNSINTTKTTNNNSTTNNTNNENNTNNIIKKVEDSSINFSLQLTSEDIWHAYTTIKPSLLPKDRLNFQYIYEKFQGLNDKGQNYDGCNEVEQGKKSENENEDISAVYLEMKRQLGTKTSMM